MKFKDGDVVRYTPADTWCHHGIAIVHIEGGRMWATDTYWGGSPTDRSYVDIAQLSPENIIGNTHTFGEAPYPHHYDDYREEDKYWIPTGGSSSHRRVRIGATPDAELKEARLRYAVTRAEEAADYARRTIAREMQEYERHVGRPYVAATPENKEAL